MLLNLFALGTAGAIVAVPFREIGKYYFKFHATLALLLVAGAAILGRPWEGLLEGKPLARLAAGGALFFALLVLFENVLVRAAGSDLRRDALLMPVSFGAIFVALASLVRSEYRAGETLVLLVHLLSSAAVLGGALVAMTTGHWYLANARLPFEILVRLCRFLVWALLAKAVVVGLLLAARGGDYLRLEAFDQLVIATRLLAGILLALLLAWMSLSCAKRRSNQSATGILYVAVVFVLIGETISLHLTLGAGRPV
jgi:hypothetical protein